MVSERPAYLHFHLQGRKMFFSVLIKKVMELSKTDTDFTIYGLKRVWFHLQCNYLDY